MAEDGAKDIAKDLLDLAKAVVDWLDANGSPWWSQPLYEKAQAAIVKATVTLKDVG